MAACCRLNAKTKTEYTEILDQQMFKNSNRCNYEELYSFSSILI